MPAPQAVARWPPPDIATPIRTRASPSAAPGADVDAHGTGPGLVPWVRPLGRLGVRPRRGRGTRTGAPWARTAASKSSSARFDASPPAKPVSAPSGPDDSVAGQDDADRVLAVGSPDGSGLVRVPEEPRLLAVRGRLAVGDGGQGAPGLHLERGAVKVERQVERAPPAGEVLAQLRRRRAGARTWSASSATSIGHGILRPGTSFGQSTALSPASEARSVERADRARRWWWRTSSWASLQVQDKAAPEVVERVRAPRAPRLGSGRGRGRVAGCAEAVEGVAHAEVARRGTRRGRRGRAARRRPPSTVRCRASAVSCASSAARSVPGSMVMSPPARRGGQRRAASRLRRSGMARAADRARPPRPASGKSVGERAVGLVEGSCRPPATSRPAWVRAAATETCWPSTARTRQLGAVDVPGRAAAGRLRDERGQQRVGAEQLGDGDGVGVEVEQAARPLHGAGQVAEVVQPDGAARRGRAGASARSPRARAAGAACAGTCRRPPPRCRARPAGRGRPGGRRRRTAGGRRGATRSIRRPADRWPLRRRRVAVPSARGLRAGRSASWRTPRAPCR